MKTLLKISLLLNLGLIGFVIALSITNRPASFTQAADVTAVSQVAGVIAPTPPPSPRVEVRPFRWSEVESTDYPAYIANLRRIGCPEATIRDIIQADLDSTYADRRAALRRKLDSSPSSGGLRARESEAAQWRNLQDEEAAVLAALLGNEPAPSRPPAGPQPASEARPGPEPGEACPPLVFQPIEAATSNLSDEQIQGIDRLRQWFTDEVGGPQQDPNDPAYRRRWLKAQALMDGMTRGMIGASAFENCQLAAHAAQPAAAESQ
jgi:hypothetical protein